MKEIKYKNKKLKLPYDLTEGEASMEMVTRINPFSGQSIDLPRFAAIIYDTVIDLNLKAERKDSATGQQPGFSGASVYVFSIFSEAVEVHYDSIFWHFYSFLFFILLFNCVRFVALGACCRNPEAWRLKLLAIDPDPWTKLGPSIAHDFELSCDGQQLGRRRMFNLYCELFHFFLGSISFLTMRNISSIASAILFNCFVSIIFLS